MTKASGQKAGNVMRTRDTATEMAPGEQSRELGLPRPVLTLACVALIGLLALTYLSQVAGVAQANSQLRDLNAEQTRLERQDAQLHQQLGTVTSPAYIDRRAREMGLAPALGTPPLTIGIGGQP
jgi:hypothetical protein